MAQPPLAVPKDGDKTASSGGGWLLPFVVALFFAWGFATVMIDALAPKLKGLFALNYAEAMLTQFAFFIAYFVMSIPAAVLLSRVGYLWGIIIGLVVMAAGCLLFSPVAAAGVYWGFLAALFIMASGITLLQVAANPLIAIIGREGRSHFRLNMAQALNSLGTFIGPFVGAAIILKSGVTPPDPARTPPDVLAAYRLTEAHAVQAPFLGIAAGLILLAVIFWLLRKAPNVPAPARNETGLASFRLLTRPRLALGVLCIFLYVGAEVAIGSLMTNYLLEPKNHAVAVAAGTAIHDALRDFTVASGLGRLIPALVGDNSALSAAAAAGTLVAFYWGGAMVGRLVGSALLYLKVPAARLLTACAVGAIGLVVLSSATAGALSVWTIIAVGLTNSIMFPTIFTLGIEGMGAKTPQASGLLCMAIVGGAIVPLITGATADVTGLSLALLAPAACYLVIAAYGLFAHSNKVVEDVPVVVTP
ncbi:FHS family L-fucose permease-like MFS transporter [Caulobacter ginsengisoli]|uniref:FHS family L-fucose permease-like MFS transporter n=1 Tax=Caulobacter ginsengisoli TaxID=400775 RepID=A0ABU0IQP5_9CAUL|nr:sugar MFS transporter [Caulobacter ginsengisoli]MDQ0464335.1 FHS family L-fucose permease-like MFS transporter [Caulobacter ginsengisoli]